MPWARTKSGFTSPKSAIVCDLFEYRLVWLFFWLQSHLADCQQQVSGSFGISFVSIMGEKLLLSEIGDPKMPFKLNCKLISLSYCLFGIFERPRFYKIVHSPTLNPVLTFLTLQWSLEVDWKRMCLATEDLFPHYYWTPGHTFGLPDQWVEERKRNGGGQIV